ncbi:MAG: molybdenum cofactor guanylyltransferase [Planctomycetaceae bacterium]|nr:molybdenum cofactor guanylyltransferase [Planctomycetaceae bacterium]
MQDQQQSNSVTGHPQGYILCGGQSRRFGSDKARLEIDNTPMISRVADSLSRWTQPIIAIADKANKYQDLKLETITDLQAGLGPLGGLQTALLHAKEHSSIPWIVLTSCDMTTLSTDWLDEIWVQAQSPEQYQAVLFEETSPPRLNPFPGCYHISLLSQIEKQLQAKTLAFKKLILSTQIKIKTIPLPQDWPSVPQINTIQDATNWENSQQQNQ